MDKDLYRLRFGCQLITYGDVDLTMKYARLAEKSGFDMVSLPDHLFHPSDKRFWKYPPWDVYVMLGAIGARTKFVELMPAVSDVLRRHPATIAHSIATLDHLTKGRAVLGVGAGEAFNLEPIPDVRWNRPVKTLEEAIEVINRLWSSTKDKPADFDGVIFKLRNANLGFTPIRKTKPIYVGGYGPRIKKAIAKFKCAWLPWIETPESYERGLKEIEMYSKAISDSSPEEHGLLTPTLISDDGEEARKSMTPKMKVILSLRRRLLNELGYDKLADCAIDMWKATLRGEQLDEVYSLAETIPDDLVSKTSIVGTPDEAIDIIEKFVKAGLRLLIVALPVQQFIENVALYRKRIIPYFR